jgi:hypothetical protein
MMSAPGRVAAVRAGAACHRLTSVSALLLFMLLFFGTIGLAIYFIPSIVGFVRRVPNRGVLVAVNAFLGWTLIGWVVAMAMALRPPGPAGRAAPLEATVVDEASIYEARELAAAAEELPEDPFATS